MKGFINHEYYDTKKTLVDTLILKGLPYGMWTTKDNKEYLFNRDYEPILGWDLELCREIPVAPFMWIESIVKQEYFYGKHIEYPTKDVKTLRKCWDILAEWSKRSGH